MSCKQCTTKFNFFHKESGCANCGLSFCSKCLKQKCKVASKGPGEYQVCKNCFLKLQNSQTTSTTPSLTIITPPEAFIRRLEALENPVKNPITIYKNPKASNLLPTTTSTNLPTDAQLLHRLEKLKDTGKGPPPTESELRKRLANLKGTNEYVEGPSKQNFLNVKDSRTSQEKADNLLEQFLTERDIELSQNPQEELEIRLASLREQGIRPNEGPYLKNLHDSTSSSEDEVERITKKIMDEVALDAKVEAFEISDKGSREEVTEEYLCIVCNNEAKFRCLDCDGDLYCVTCTKVIHDDWDKTHYKHMQEVTNIKKP